MPLYGKCNISVLYTAQQNMLYEHVQIHLRMDLLYGKLRKFCPRKASNPVMKLLNGPATTIDSSMCMPSWNR